MDMEGGVDLAHSWRWRGGELGPLLNRKRSRGLDNLLELERRRGLSAFLKRKRLCALGLVLELERKW